MRFCEKKGGCQWDAPVWGTDKNTGIGYCKGHQSLRTDLDKRSITAKAIAKHKEEKKRKPGWFEVERIEINECDGTLMEVIETDRKINNNGRSGELWRWFQNQREFMKGTCAHCGGKTQKYDDDTFHYSICHIFPKNHFKSIATNDSNWIELCYYGNSCHANFDNKMISITDLNCFNDVIEKFAVLYPLMTREEKRRVPTVLLQYLETEI